MINLCSFNIHGAVGGLDRKYDPDRVVRVMHRINADVFGLQEVRLPPQIRNVLDSFKPGEKYNTLFLKTLEDDRGLYGNVLISRFPILQHVDLDLDISEEHRGSKNQPEARRAIAAEIEAGMETPLWVIVTHLAVGKAARRLQSAKLIRLIHEILDVKHELCVLMGDMNEWIYPRSFIKELDQIFARHVMRRTFPAIFPVLALDGIWISQGLQATRVWAFRGPEARTASDHRPVCATIRQHQP